MRGESDDVPTQPADLKVEKTRKDIAAGGLVSFFFFLLSQCLQSYSPLHYVSLYTQKNPSHLISKSVSSCSLIVNRAPLLCLCLPACCLCVSECVRFRVSGLIISDRDVIGV